MIHILEIPEKQLLEDSVKATGSYSSILYNPGIDTFLKDKFGRAGLCLKIYNDRYTEGMASPDSRIIEETRIQNIFALYDLAPMVYRIVFIRYGEAQSVYLAQVTEYENNREQPDYYAMSKIIEEYKICTINKGPSGKFKYDFTVGCNWVGDKFVDFGGWYFG